MIHPRRLKGTPANIARYYTVGDYYTKGTDEHSEWGGAIAADLGLNGKVDPAVLQQLLDGKVAGQQLGRHRSNGQIEHHPGWDFAVNAPKSVSIMALVAGDDRIVTAHEQAVGTALGYLEEHAALRRRDHGTVVEETTGRLLFARFIEHASRELDPHLHSHVVVMNMTNRETDAPMASLETRAMFAEQMVAGQVYRNELAHHLRTLGYEVDFDPRKGLFEIRGVPKEALALFSKRAEQIDVHAKEHGLEGQAARRKSFYETRGPKAKTGIEDLRAGWKARSAPYAKDIAVVRAVADKKGEQDITPAAGDVARAALFGIRQAETREAVNNLGQMFRLGLASHVGEVRLAELRPRIAEHEARRKLLATRTQTGDHILTRGRTTRRTARLEQALSQHLVLALDDVRAIASSDRLLSLLEGAGLTAPQEQALVHMATARDRVTAVHGVAGAGKSTLVKTLNDAATHGTTLVALAPTSSAAANLGHTAGIESRTVASLLASGGKDITDRHVLVLDEAGQLGNRQALRVLEISRMTGARLILLGDNKQTGAIEQGKAFWLLQKLGMPTAQLAESLRQETRAMKAAVTQARAGDYAGSLGRLDKVVSGADAETLARGLVAEWTRLKPENRATTNILVLENATRLVVNSQIRETLKREGVVAAEYLRLQVLTPSGMSDQEKHFARFYSGGQVVTFARDIARPGIARDTEYRVLGIARSSTGRQIVRLVDEQGRVIRWDPRLGRASQINVFQREERDLARGDRIQWRLASKTLDLKNAERGTVEKLDGSLATIRWDRGDRVQIIDLAEHKTWDHGYAETVYSAQSKTYARAYVLAPVNSSLVNGQNYYTAITRARFGVKLWTEDEKRLAEKLAARSGEKTSALEGLGRLGRDNVKALSERHREKIDRMREEQIRGRQDGRDRALDRRLGSQLRSAQNTGERLLRGGTGDEYPIQLFAAHRIAVLSVQRPRPVGYRYPNRDSVELERNNQRDWADRKSVLSSLERGIAIAATQGSVDPTRVGITGLSDGTANVQYALINSNLFKAASVSSSFEGMDTLIPLAGPAGEENYVKWGYPRHSAQNPDFWRCYSLARNAARIRAPILMQLSSDEYQGALEDYVALRQEHVPSELYVFPDEHHIKWQPAHRLALYRRNLAWFDFWLNENASAAHRTGEIIDHGLLRVTADSRQARDGAAALYRRAATLDQCRG